MGSSEDIRENQMGIWTDEDRMAFDSSFEDLEEGDGAMAVRTVKFVVLQAQCQFCC